MSLDISLKLADVSNLSTGRLLAGFEDKTGALHDGRIKSNGNYYEVKFLEGGTAEVRRNYQGPFAWFRNRWCSHETTRAKALQEKINTILSQSKSDEYRILSGTHRQLLGIIEKSTAKTIEVANYGFEPNRTKISDEGLVSTMNEKLKADGRMISFNKIDDYNAFLDISPNSFNPINMHEMIEDISGGRLQTRFPADYKDNFNLADIKQWKTFLGKPENVAKIDIPSKLYRYMHLPEGHKASKETGWEAAFAKDKTAAMRAFILKNIPFLLKGLADTQTVDMLADRMTRYVEIYAIKDDAERNKALGKFMSSSNWLLPKEQESFNKLAQQIGLENATRRADETAVTQRKAYNLFRNVISYAFFRQTSKLGLEFFRNKGTPVMFQFADYAGKSYLGREDDLRRPEAWRNGEDTDEFRQTGGSPITNSEMRRAVWLNAAHGPNLGDPGIIMV